MQASLFCSKKNLLFFCCITWSFFCHATIRYVKTGNAGTAPYTNWGTASNDLQAVINQCVAGDEIWIAAGSYRPNRRADALTVITAADRNNAFVLKNGVKVYGGFTGVETLLGQRNSTTHVVTLSGDIGTALNITDNCYHVVISANNSSTTTLLDGVTISGGNANAAAGVLSITVNTFTITPRYGGGMYKVSSAADISDCRFSRNNASLSGAGIYETLSTVSSVYSNCSIVQNSSADDGGGMYILTSSCLYQACNFTSNDATGNGAGIYIRGTGSPAFTTCIISSNDAIAEGGAFYLTGSGSPTFTNCTINTNTAGSNGGAVASYTTGSAGITATIISGNTSSSAGGGLFTNNSPVELTNCLISGNLAAAGGGIWNSFSDAIIINCTIAGNRATAQGGGIANGTSNPTIQNCIVYGNTGVPTSTNTIYNSGSTPVVQYSLIEGGYAGTGNQSANPLFVNQAAAFSAPTIGGDYRVQKCSPALNGGNNAYIPPGITTDLDGNSRISYGTADMGAYEKQLILAVPDANGIVYVDITKTGNGSSWVNAVAELSDALAAAKYNTAIQQIWVAKGTYKPKYSVVNNSLYCTTTSRDNAFVLVKDVKLIGGFAGGETDTTGRNFVTNETILSGDLNTPANTDNCYHILVSAGNMGTALVNGFSITGGMANSTGTVSVNSINIERQNGAAVFNASSGGFLTIELCKIHDNTASVEAGGFFSRAGSVAVINNCSFITNSISNTGNGGAAIYNESNTNITISNCSFTSNTAITSTPGYGGAILNSVAVIANISNCIFIANQANFGGAIHNNTCTAIIAGCSFINNTATTSNGGAISNTQTVIGSTIADCIISGNTATAGSGGGIYNSNAKLTIRNSNIIGNQSQQEGGGMHNTGSNSDIKIYNSHINENTSINYPGGGIYDNNGDLLLDKCTVCGNTATATSGIYLINSNLYLYNSLLSGNKSNNDRPALHLDVSSTATVIGCTIAANKKQSGTTGSAILADGGSGSALTLRNSIVWGNQGIAAGAAPIAISAGTISVTYSLIEGGFAGTGNINTNPLFMNQQAATAAPTAAGDYRLQKCSPAMNAGSNALVPPGITKDLDSASRISYSIVDMGAYEKQFAIQDAAGIVYVDNTKNGNGSSWANAVTELADALIAAKDNTAISQIWVAKGTYHPRYNAADGSSIICPSASRDNAFVLVNNVKVYGGFAGGETDTIGRDFATNETILSGDMDDDGDAADNCYHVGICAGNAGSATLDGFTITKGNANLVSNISVNTQTIARQYGGAMINVSSSPAIVNCKFSANNSLDNGGALHNRSSSPAINNCLFSGNTTNADGGGMYNELSSPAISGCIFSGNSAGIGAGMYNDLSSSPPIVNCIFSGNSSSGAGGGIINLSSCSPAITNCTIVYNKAVSSGGGMYNSPSASPVVTNGIIYGNTAAAGNSISGSTAIVSYSLVEGGYAGTGNYNEDPLFVSPQTASAAPTTGGNYRLQACSPAINTGNNSAVPVTVTADIDKSYRIAYTDVDMGAYEVQSVDLANTTWKGVNTNWNDKINWCGGYIPYDTTNVTVPLTGNNPLINAGYDNEVKNISFANNTSIGIGTTGRFTINGTYTNNGCTVINNGDWVMAGNASGQTFPGISGTVSAMNNLEVNNPGGLKFDKSFQLTGTFTPTAGNINVDNATITLNSDATATARVATVPSTVTFSYNGTGKFEIERYIPPHRAWRLLTAPVSNVTNLTISQAWQEGVSNANRLSPINPAAGFGATITKSTAYSAADGYDQGSTNNPSIRYYNGAGWGGVPSQTNGTAPGANNGLINDQQGYMLFIRGDRSIQVAGTGVAATVTTLRPKGQLKVGPQIINCSGWTVIGNPYASPVNFHKIVLDNPGLPDAFYVWDANLTGSNDVGGWVSYGSYNNGTQTYAVAPLLPGSTFANNKGDISSGSAFMVNYTGTITINENNKSTLGDNALYRPPAGQLSMNLFVINADSTTSLNDGIAILVDGPPGAASAEKNTNFAENLAIVFENRRYAIQNRHRPDFNDTIFIYTGQMKQRDYMLEIKAGELNMPYPMKAYLEDTYLRYYQPVALEGSTRYTFSVSADSASVSAARFRLLFKKPVTFGPIQAVAKEKNIEVQWKMEENFGIEQYEIERSLNGIDFAVMEDNRNQQPLFQNQWLDVSPATGTYYYRIKAITSSGEIIYSKIAKASVVNNNAGMYVYPNPVVGGKVQVRLNEMPKGVYYATVRSSTGQELLTEKWQHTGGWITKIFQLPPVVAKGNYQLEIILPSGKHNTMIVQVQ